MTAIANTLRSHLRLIRILHHYQIRREALVVDNVFSKQARFFSSNSNDNETDVKAQSEQNNNADPVVSVQPELVRSDQVERNKCLFPWRSHGLDNLLPRVTPTSMEAKTLIPIPNLHHYLVTMIMNVGWLDAVFFGQWARDLSQGMTFAFVRGMAGIMSSAFGVPLEQVSTEQNDRPGIHFEYSPSNQDDKDHSQDISQEINDMVSEPLRDLFHAARDQGNDPYKIRLELVPKRTEFFRIYGIPSITPQKVQEHPDIVFDIFFRRDEATGDYVTNPQTSLLRFSYDQFDQLIQQKQQTVRTTIAAEAMVVCDEIFQVTDAQSGNLLQGHDDDDNNNSDESSLLPREVPREVAHMVTRHYNNSTRHLVWQEKQCYRVGTEADKGLYRTATVLQQNAHRTMIKGENPSNGGNHIFLWYRPTRYGQMLTISYKWITPSCFKHRCPPPM